MWTERRPLRLLDAAQDTAALALPTLGPLLLGDGLGPLPGLLVYTVTHEGMSNTLHRGQRRRPEVNSKGTDGAGGERPKRVRGGNLQKVPPMRLSPIRSIPWMLVLAAACSANSPTRANSAALARGSGSNLTASPDIRESVRQLTARGAENLDISPGAVAGSKIIRIRNGYSEVLLARTNADGTVSTACVDSPGGADAFLSSTAPSAPAKAAQ